MDTLHQDLRTFMVISRWILFRIRNISNKTFWHITTHSYC